MQQLLSRWTEFKHKARLWSLGLNHDARYRTYLRIQFERALPRRRQPLMKRTRSLVDRLLELSETRLKGPVLCIGCRNSAEVEYFKSKGLSNVVGIDLFSESPDILVMDMQHMTFPDNHFEIIYASHSLEHADDVRQVIKEIVRVARPGARVAVEVPVKYETQGADLVDFRDCQTLHLAFQPYLGRVIWADERPPHSPDNESGTSIIRTVFVLQKDTP